MFDTIRSRITMAAGAAALVGTLSLPGVAGAATSYDFSFENVGGPVAGTVSGSIELPDGDGTFAATGLTVTSAPAALGYTLPFDVLANLTSVLENTFTVAGGLIDAGSSHFYAFFTPDSIIGSAFGLNSVGGFVTGSSMSIQLSSSPATGVIDSSSSTLSYTTTGGSGPEPSSVALLALGALGFAGNARRAYRARRPAKAA